MPRLTIMQPEPVSPCIAMAEGGLATAQIARKQASNTEIYIYISISGLTGECAAEKFKNFCSSSLWTCLHHMVILGSQNKITDFL